MATEGADKLAERQNLRCSGYSSGWPQSEECPLQSTGSGGDLAGSFVVTCDSVGTLFSCSCLLLQGCLLP